MVKKVWTVVALVGMVAALVCSCAVQEEVDKGDPRFLVGDLEGKLKIGDLSYEVYEVVDLKHERSCTVLIRGYDAITVLDCR